MHMFLWISCSPPSQEQHCDSLTRALSRIPNERQQQLKAARQTVAALALRLRGRTELLQLEMLTLE